MVTRPGFEPRQTESESVVLPLYYRALKNANLRFKPFIFFIKIPAPFPSVKKAKNIFNLGTVGSHLQNNDSYQKSGREREIRIASQFHRFG